LAEEEGKSRAEEGRFGWAKSARESRVVQQSIISQKRGHTVARKRAKSGQATSAEEGRKSEAIQAEFSEQGGLRRRVVQVLHCWVVQPHLGWVLLLKYPLISAVRKFEFLCCNLSFLISQ
jgi:hypothetical protein